MKSNYLILLYVISKSILSFILRIMNQMSIKMNQKYHLEDIRIIICLFIELII